MSISPVFEVVINEICQKCVDISDAKCQCIKADPLWISHSGKPGHFWQVTGEFAKSKQERGAENQTDKSQWIGSERTVCEMKPVMAVNCKILFSRTWFKGIRTVEGWGTTACSLWFKTEVPSFAVMSLLSLEFAAGVHQKCMERLRANGL